MKEIILKYALANAVQFNGKANENAVLGKVLAERPEYKKEIKKLKLEIKKIVKEVNSWPIEKQIEELKKTGYKKPVIEQREGLPELPNAIPGKVVTRFAPEPNGYMHFGHLKSAFLSFLYAKKYGGKFFLRFDDTNPEKERKEFYDAIREDLETFGIKYQKEVRESDYMEKFYEICEDLIKKSVFYVCECPQEEIKKQRAQGIACVHRSQSPSENLNSWEKMLKNAKEGSMVVRFKIDFTHPNPALRDPSMFRIVLTPHPLLKKKYRVYPMYNFASVVVDHEIGTTHILRDKGFENDAMIQERLFNVLEYNLPEVIQFGRVKTVANIPMKKRKLKDLMEKGFLTNFEDIRIPTPRNLLKRGFKPEAIRRVIEEIGPSKNDIDISIDTIEAYNRQLIDKEANRYFFVGEPIEITLSRIPNKTVDAPVYPGKRKYRKIPVSRKILIDKIDLTQYRGKEVRLMYLANVVLDKKAKVTGLTNKDIPKIHWVPAKSVKISVIMPDGREVVGLAEPEIKKVKPDQIVQFERIGFARCDKPGFFYFAHK